MVEVRAAPDTDTVGISVESDLLSTGALGLFFDFPYSDLNKFDAPFVGVWNATSNHSTSLQTVGTQATIKHTLNDNSYSLTAQWGGDGKITGPEDGTHRYFLTVSESGKLNVTANFSPDGTAAQTTLHDLTVESSAWWASYWSSGAFIDLTSVDSANSTELQRRIILSQYLLAVNSASSFPPQESGLVNNGWYGKFHLEMVFWHLVHFARWGHFDLMWRSMPNMYDQFLPSSIERAAEQGYKGARWGKMTDPSGRSAPGEINSLLIWQQPHPMYFAEVEYRAFPNDTTLERWDEVLTASADFMASFPWFDNSSGVYNLGPPMYPVSENTNPNATINPTFELAYWRFGLDIAIRWKERQGQSAPEDWVTVRDKLAPLPVVDETYPVYEGIPNMWSDNATTNDVSSSRLLSLLICQSRPSGNHQPLMLAITAPSDGWNLRLAAAPNERASLEPDRRPEHGGQDSGALGPGRVIRVGFLSPRHELSAAGRREPGNRLPSPPRLSIRRRRLPSGRVSCSNAILP